MRVLVLTQYYLPEQVGAAIWIAQLAADLVAAGHQVTVLTSFPNHPDGVIPPPYRGKVFQREISGGVRVVRTYIYPTPSRAFWPRVLTFGSFIFSSLVGGALSIPAHDVIYAILPPLPLGVTAVLLARLKSARLILNLQDIYPDIAVSTGVLRNKPAIRFFQGLEKWIYRRAACLLVVSEGFRQNLTSKGVPEAKIRVIPNWADPDSIRPQFDAELRREWGGGNFAVVYSGAVSHNSTLEPLLAAAGALRDAPFKFIICGEGVKKAGLQAAVREKGLENVCFRPYAPLDRYAAVLSTADMNVVTLHPAAASSSAPSKIYKMMAAGRPVLAIAPPESEIARLVSAAQCGICVSPNQPEELAAALRHAATHRAEIDQMGAQGRSYLQQHHGRRLCTAQINRTLLEVAEAGEGAHAR
jgi:colanic acid biosynthesis glycosyl transferase WcaI